MKIKILLSILLVVILISGFGCTKKTETTGKETEIIQEPIAKEGSVVKSLFEVTRGLDPGLVTYYYYKINPTNGMKIEASSENNFNVEVMSNDDCVKKTKGAEYITLAKQENIKSFSYSSSDKDISSEVTNWCVAVTNSDTVYSRAKMKIDELGY